MSISPKFFYTIEPLADAKIESITSEATGFPIENALDHNLDTYWKPTSTDNQEIDIDLGSALQVDGLAFFIKNYDTDHSNSPGLATVNLKRSSDNITYTLQGGGSVNLDNSVGTPIWFHNTALTSGTYRYWRIELQTMNTTIEIGQIFLYRSRNITANSAYPVDDISSYANRSVSGPGGRRLVAGINSIKTRKFTRRFQLSGLTDHNTLVSVHDACRGALRPFILTEGGAETDPNVVRYVNSKRGRNETDHEIFNPVVSLETVPYIPDGATF